MPIVELEYKSSSCGTTATKLGEMYKDSGTELKADKQLVNKVAVRTDFWTALIMESCSTITCHFIQDLDFFYGENIYIFLSN